MQKSVPKPQRARSHFKSVTPRSQPKRPTLSTNNATTHAETVERALYTCSQRINALHADTRQCQLLLKDCAQESPRPTDAVHSSTFALARDVRTSLRAVIAKQQHDNDALSRQIAQLKHERAAIQQAVLTATRLCAALESQLGSYAPRP